MCGCLKRARICLTDTLFKLYLHEHLQNASQWQTFSTSEQTHCALVVWVSEWVTVVLKQIDRSGVLRCSPLMFGVPQGSVLRPVLFVLFCFVLYSIFRPHRKSLSNHQLSFCRRHPTSKINSTKWRTKPYTWPVIMYRRHKRMVAQQPT